jgi:hypothetical protein
MSLDRKQQRVLGGGAIAALVVLCALLGVRIDHRMSAGDLAVGLGTAALAFFTWGLAKQTRADVATSAESVRLARIDIELSRKTLQATDMPYVIPSDAPFDPNGRVAPDRPEYLRGIVFHEGHRRAVLIVRLWNIGKGPAIVKNVGLTVGPTRILETLIGQMPITPGDARDEELLCVSGTNVPPEKLMRGTMTIDYLHSDGSEWRTECQVTITGSALTCETFRRVQIDTLLPEVYAQDG